MTVVDAIKKIAAATGLSDEIEADLLADEGMPSIDFDQALPGTAAEVLELFLGEGDTECFEDEKGWLWAPLIRSGQHALRPGTRGQKVRTPLKVIAGKSKDPLKEIGLGDLTDGFERDAVDYVTVPTSHDNKVLENTGFIRGVKVKSAAITTGPKKGQKVPTLFGAYDFTEPGVKDKIKRGTIPGRSCGILYNYENTETGEVFPSVLEHVALTTRPWIRGMTPFGRRLAERKEPPVAMSLSDEPSAEDDQIVSDLADGDDSTTSISWTHEESPSWIRQQINDLLQEARAEKRKTTRSRGMMVEESTPYYRAMEVKPDGNSGGQALICDGYGDGSNYWVVGFQIDSGNVSLEDFNDWQAVKSVYVPDGREPPPPAKEPLEEEEDPPTRLEAARIRRRARARGEDLSLSSDTTTHPRGGEKMDPKENGSGALQLSEEARQLLADANARAEKAEKRAEGLEEKVDRFSEKSKAADVRDVLDELRGIGFDEQHGQTGFLSEMEQVLLTDDGDPVAASEHFSEDGKTETAITLTDAFRRVFKALKVGEDGKIALGEQLEKPSAEAEESDDPDGSDGKPSKEDPAEDDLSVDGAEKRVAELLADNPDLAAIAPVAKSDGGDD